MLGESWLARTRLLRGRRSVTISNFLPPPSALPKLEKLEIYEQLWQEAEAAFSRGEPKIDPYLAEGSRDPRRGVTLVFRPPAAVREAVAGFLDRLAEICPGQYFYQREQMHVTVLVVVSGTEHWQREMERVEQTRGIIGDALKKCAPFQIRFQGVTASPGVVLVQGFPLDNGLAAIREALRDALTRHGLGDMPDRRYKSAGAHLSIMRFRQPCPEIRELHAFLAAHRQTNFGDCEISELKYYLADWCATADTVQMLGEYSLRR